MSTSADGVKKPVIAYRQKFTLRSFLLKNATQVGIFAVFMGLWLFFALRAPETFLSSRIYMAFLTTVPFFGVIALPLTMLVIEGEMDLSFGSVMAVSVVGFLFVYNATASPILGVLAAFAVGVACGLLNGGLVVFLGIPSLVATIGTQFLWRGATVLLVNGKGQTLGELRETFLYQVLVGKTIGEIPNQFFWMLFVAIGCWFLLNRTAFGAHIYLIGDNEPSARLMGVNVRRTRVYTFILVGLASAFAGVLTTFYLANFFPSLGDGTLLPTLASVFLGGTSVFGGVGTIFGTFLGSYIIGAINAAVVAMGLTGFWTQFIYGLIVIIAVAMHAVIRRRMAR